jgi:hypothetical protein
MGIGLFLDRINRIDGICFVSPQRRGERREKTFVACRETMASEKGSAAFGGRHILGDEIKPGRGHWLQGWQEAIAKLHATTPEGLNRFARPPSPGRAKEKRPSGSSAPLR